LGERGPQHRGSPGWTTRPVARRAHACASRLLFLSRSRTTTKPPSRLHGIPAKRPRRGESGGRTGGSPDAAVAGHWGTWSTRWNWAQRAAAYDALIAVAKCEAEVRRRRRIANWGLSFEIAEQDRVEQRSEKIMAVLNKANHAPMTDVTQTIEERWGPRVLKKKTYVEGINQGGLATNSSATLSTNPVDTTSVMHLARGGGQILTRSAWCPS
jgi:hypothetical protein